MRVVVGLALLVLLAFAAAFVVGTLVGVSLVGVRLVAG